MCTARSFRIVSLFAAGLLLNLGCSEEVLAPSSQDERTASVALATAGTPIPFRHVDAGTRHACGIAGGQAYCWGDSRYGQLGTGTVREGPESCAPSSGEPELTCSTRPVAVTGTIQFLQLSAGESHTCGIANDYRAYCWGRNSHGQGGNGYGITDATGTPTPLATNLRFRQVSAGTDHTCGITRLDDRAYCWGSYISGELGDGRTGGFGSPTPVAVAGGHQWRDLSAGNSYTCGVTIAGRAYCWGNNSHGALGNGSTTNRSIPAPVASSMQFLRISAGFSHTCAINIGHRAFCWGANNAAQIGDNTLTRRLTPTAVAGTRVFERVSANVEFTCAVTRTGQGVCWGQGAQGQLGNGTTWRRGLPTPLSEGLVFADVSGGLAYGCGVTMASRAYCWGNNFWGNLGDGTQETRLKPTPVAGT